MMQRSMEAWCCRQSWFVLSLMASAVPHNQTCKYTQAVLVRDEEEKAKLKQHIEGAFGSRAARGLIILTIAECKGLEFKVCTVHSCSQEACLVHGPWLWPVVAAGLLACMRACAHPFLPKSAVYNHALHHVPGLAAVWGQ